MKMRNSFREFKVEDYDKEIAWFRKRIQLDGLSDCTLESYCWTLGSLLRTYNGVLNPDNILDYKVKLIDSVAPATVNARIHGVNKYMWEKGLNFHLKTVKVEPRQYLENVISKTDYKHLKRMLKRDHRMYYYLVTTGARISEILTLRVEHVYEGMFSVYGKGAKHRTLFITNVFQKECMSWLSQTGQKEGYIYSLDGGITPLKPSQVRDAFQRFAKWYHIDTAVMHPHGFRHFFGKMYMQNGGDIVTLASIMGHSSIETTKRYLLVSLEEAKAQYNRIVTW